MSITQIVMSFVQGIGVRALALSGVIQKNIRQLGKDQ